MLARVPGRAGPFSECGAREMVGPLLCAAGRLGPPDSLPGAGTVLDAGEAEMHPRDKILALLGPVGGPSLFGGRDGDTINAPSIPEGALCRGLRGRGQGEGESTEAGVDWGGWPCWESRCFGEQRTQGVLTVG